MLFGLNWRVWEWLIMEVGRKAEQASIVGKWGEKNLPLHTLVSVERDSAKYKSMKVGVEL
jgi:hypothetical protein